MKTAAKNLTPDQLHLLHEEAVAIAKQAGALINEYADKNTEVMHKPGGASLATQVLTEVDLKCDALIRDGLTPSVERFNMALLTEETEDDGRRLEKDYFWCVDPMDGTLAFTRGQHGYAVSISLISNAGVPVIGIAYDPMKQNLYSAIHGQGAFLNSTPWTPLGSPEEIVDPNFTVPLDCSFVERADFAPMWQNIESWAQANGFDGAKRVDNGGAVMSALWVLEQAHGCYFKPPKNRDGGGSVWDFAATACIYNELGLHARDFSGKPFHFNPSGSTYMNHCGVMYTTGNFANSFRAALKDDLAGSV